MNQIRVVYVTDIPTQGIIEAVRGLARKVDLTCFFCSETGTRGVPWDFSQKVDFNYKVIGGAVVRRRDAEGTDYYLSPRIFWQLIRSRPNVIISTGFSFPTFYSLFYSRLWGAKLIVYSDGTTLSEQSNSWLQRMARKIIIPQIAACVAKSAPAAKRFEELGATGRIFVAPYPANSELYEIAAARDWSERDELHLLCVGRLIKRKGVHHLLRALAGMRPTRRPVRLTIVGSGPEESDLRALAQSLALQRVQFAGFVNDSELQRFYAQADVFVFPTLNDPYGITLLEAAASGLALITSCDSGATEDLVQENESGLIIDPRDESAFADRIALLADSHDLVVRLAKSAFNVARERTPDRTAQGYLSAINAALAESPR